VTQRVSSWFCTTLVYLSRRSTMVLMIPVSYAVSTMKGFLIIPLNPALVRRGTLPHKCCSSHGRVSTRKFRSRSTTADHQQCRGKQPNPSSGMVYLVAFPIYLQDPAGLPCLRRHYTSADIEQIDCWSVESRQHATGGKTPPSTYQETNDASKSQA